MAQELQIFALKEDFQKQNGICTPHQVFPTGKGKSRAVFFLPKMKTNGPSIEAGATRMAAHSRQLQDAHTDLSLPPGRLFSCAQHP